MLDFVHTNHYEQVHKFGELGIVGPLIGYHNDIIIGPAVRHNEKR